MKEREENKMYYGFGHTKYFLPANASRCICQRQKHEATKFLFRLTEVWRITSGFDLKQSCGNFYIILGNKSKKNPFHQYQEKKSN